jgi:hypothetical protein
MIEVLPGMSEGVTGIRMSGRLRGDDLHEFKPAMEELLKTGEIRIVEVVAPDYEGFGPGGLADSRRPVVGDRVVAVPVRRRPDSVVVPAVID